MPAKGNVSLLMRVQKPSRMISLLYWHVTSLVKGSVDSWRLIVTEAVASPVSGRDSMIKQCDHEVQSLCLAQWHHCLLLSKCKVTALLKEKVN